MDDKLTQGSISTINGTSISELTFNYNIEVCKPLEGYKLKPVINFNIKKVIFNNPATIVYWEDGSKTVVKAHDEPFDPEKGLAMAIAKRAYGNKGNFNNIFKKYIKE